MVINYAGFVKDSKILVHVKYITIIVSCDSYKYRIKFSQF